MEERVMLTGNGLVGVPGVFYPFFPSTSLPHHVTITSVPQDPNNAGLVPSTAVTVVGNVVGPFMNPPSGAHLTLEIDAFVNGGSTPNDSVTWDTSGPGTTTGPKYFGQGPQVNEAVFSLPVTLQSGSTAVQNVTFQVIATGTGNGTAQWYIANTTPPQPLTGTFTIVPSLTSVTGITTPRNTAIPDSTAIVTFTNPINPSTFTNGNVSLEKNGTAVTPLTNVTIVPTDATNKTFFINGLSGYTTPPAQPTPPGSANPTPPDNYVLTVNPTGIKDPSGNSVAGSPIATPFVIDTTLPEILPLPPIPKSENPTTVLPDNTYIVTFNKPIDPTAPLTVANLQLQQLTATTPSNTYTNIPLTDPTRPVTVVPVPTDPTHSSFYINGLGAYAPPPTASSPAPVPPDNTYRLTVTSTGVKDTLGNAGNASVGGTQRISFVAAAAPFISSIAAPTPSSAPVQSLNIAFSDPTQSTPETFTLSAISLQKNIDWSAYIGASSAPLPWPINGTPVTLDPTVVTLTKTNATTYQLGGLQTLTSTPGNYALTVDSSNVKSSTGTAFAGTLTYFFSVLPGNGVVGIAAVFHQTDTTTSPHHVLITAIPQDPANDGFVNTQDVSFHGQVWRPGEASFLPPPAGGGSHLNFVIDAFEKDTSGVSQKIGEITWDTSHPGTQPDPTNPNAPYFYQGTAAQGQPGGPNYAFFGIPVHLLYATATPQNVTFTVTVVSTKQGSSPFSYGTRPFLFYQDYQFLGNPSFPPTFPLTATLTVETTAPTIAPISQPTTPRVEPVQSIDVVFSKPINPATFSVANLTLTRDGTPVPLDSSVVTITTTDNMTFHVGGLSTYTTPVGSYALTVNGAGITDLAGNAVSNSQTVSFSVVTSLGGGPQVVSVQRFGFHDQPTSIVITFNEDLNPTSASNLNAYQIFAPGPGNQPGTANGVMVTIAAAIYDASTRTVTLVPAQRLYLYDQYLLVVKGTGPNAILDVNGVPLDGKGNGQPGSDYTAVFGQQNLAGPAPGTSARASRLPNGKAILKLRRTQLNQIKRWQAFVHSGVSSKAVAPVRHASSALPRRITIRRK
jgi:hypothetical protein